MLSKKIFLPFVTLFLVIIFSFSQKTKAQNLTQIVKGTITDKITEQGLIGATIMLADTTQKLGAVTDENGKFIIPNVPLGRHTFFVNYTGYNGTTIPEILVTSGKEVVLTISLEESTEQVDEVVITANEKGEATNDFAPISARSFNLEETNRFSGGRNDIGRLVSNFAGVGTSNDARNDILVRGNSPAGVLWRMEGIPIPNPNHYSVLGNTGGPVSAINPNMMRNSDFLTGAFPAEYGNATSAVFDIALKNANPDKFETTVQMNIFSGLEAMIEAPLNKKTGASLAIAYRYSFAAIGSSLGLNVGTSAPPLYQDLTFNLNLGNTKAGKFSVFGIWANSKIDFLGAKVDTTDLFANKNEDAYNKSGFGVLGMKHTLNLTKSTFLRTVISYATTNGNFDLYKLTDNNGNALANRNFILDVREKTNTFRANTTLNSKLSAKTSLRAGFLLEYVSLDSKVNDRQYTPDWVLTRNFNGNYSLLQPYIQVQHRFNEQLTINAGFHGQYLTFNEKSIIEPRASVSYQMNKIQNISFGYGLHSQTQPLPVYFYQTQDQNGIYDQRNRNLDFTKAHHFVLGYTNRFASDWRLKAETYYQYIFDAVTDIQKSGFSMLNAGADFGFPERAGLQNGGTGTNIGLELTIEKFFSKGYYILFTSSVFDSKYKGSDGIERNTAFNSNFIFNVLAGKEWKMGKDKKNAFTYDIRLTTSGGRYTTPVDLQASIQRGRETFDETQFMGLRNPDYFRLDMKVGFRLNSSKRKISHSFYLDLQNITNNKNLFIRRYNEQKQNIGEVNQIGFFPDIMYRVQF
jgi:hypothetical protein